MILKILKKHGVFDVLLLSLATRLEGKGKCKIKTIGGKRKNRCNNISVKNFEL